MRARDWAPTRRAGLTIAAVLFLFGLVLFHVSPLPDIRPPQSVDLAFDSFVGLRQWMLDQVGYSESILAIGGAILLTVIWSIALIKHHARSALSASIVVVCPLIALQAQINLMFGWRSGGGLLYLLAAAIFFAWSLAAHPTSQPSNQLPNHPTHRTELVLLTFILAVAVFARVYDIQRMPYGIDGDESKWTIEVVATVIDGRDTLASEYHRRQLPMSFVMEAPFQIVMGPGLTPGRVGVAVYSVIATYVFYRLVRRLHDAPTALVAALLLAVSLPDITASRAGNVESHVKLWSILPLFGLAVALDTKQIKHFLLTGFAVAGAMLTYETLAPIVAVTVTLAIGAALRERHEWVAWRRRLAALATAPAFAAVVNIDYLLGRLQYYQGYRSNAEVYPLGEQLLRGVSGVLEAFRSRPYADALFSRSGPYINGLLVPLLVLGGVYAVARIRHRGSVFALTWLVWVFIPVPIVLHAPLPRIFYPGVPALYVLIAVALVAIYRAVNRAVQLPRLTAAVGILTLGTFALLNLTIWFQEVKDIPDEVRRRQVSEIAAASVAPDTLLLMPYYLIGEPVEAERVLMDLMIRERRGTLDAGKYRAVQFDNLLLTLSREGPYYPRAAVLYDLTPLARPDRREAIIAAVQRCYPNAQVVSADYFDVYHIDQHDLIDPLCRTAPLTLTAAPPPVVTGGDTTRLTFGWTMGVTAASQSTLACAHHDPDVVWIEAESFGDPQGWFADVRFVVDWSGMGYLADTLHSEYAATTIDVPHSATYTVWVRTYRRQDDGFPAFMEIGGQTLVFGEPDPGTFDEWRWQPLANLPLPAGPLSIRITRPFDEKEARFIALFVDAIALSADPDFDPTRDERWQSVLELRGPDQPLQTSGAFETQFPPGRYECQVIVRDGNRLIDEDGSVGIKSEPVEFEVSK